MANTTRYDPFNELVTLRQAMDRLLEDSFVSPLTWRTIAGSGDTVVTAPIDVHENADEIVVTASLPGVKPEDVEMTITGQALTLKGEFKADEKVDRGDYLYRERRFGRFNRSIQLPVRVEGDRAEASFENGVLTLRIPKSDEVKPRQIQIKPAHETNGTSQAAG